MPSYWKSPPKLKFTSTNLAPISAGLTYGPFKNSEHALDWIIQGGGITSVGGKKIKTEAGMVIFNQAGKTVQHDWVKKRNSLHSHFSFSIGSTSKEWPNIDKWPLYRTFSENALILQVWKSILPGRNRSPKAKLALEHISKEFILRHYLAAEEFAEPPISLYSYPPPINRSLSYIDQQISKKKSGNITLDNLANYAGVTKSHLCHIFKEHLDVSPLNCYQAIRMEKVATVLERGSDTLSTISDNFGFSSQFHLSSLFKKFFGESPAKYRARFRSGLISRPPSLIFRKHGLRFYSYETIPGKIPAPLQNK